MELNLYGCHTPKKGHIRDKKTGSVLIYMLYSVHIVGNHLQPSDPAVIRKRPVANARDFLATHCTLPSLILWQKGVFAD